MSFQGEKIRIGVQNPRCWTKYFVSSDQKVYRALKNSYTKNDGFCQSVTSRAFSAVSDSAISSDVY